MDLELLGDNEVDNNTGLVENNSLTSAESVSEFQNILRRIAFISITYHLSLCKKIEKLLLLSLFLKFNRRS